MNVTGKRIYHVLMLGAGLALLAVPPLVVISSGTARDSAQWTSLRLLALYAFTLLFINVVIGAARPLFNRIFPPRKVFVLHNFMGLAALLLALGHGILVIIYHSLSGFPVAYVTLGAVAISLLAVTVSAALARKKLKRLWRPLHRLNYLLFVIVLVHAWFLGFDFKYSHDKTAMQVVALVYAAIAALAVIYRLYTIIEARKKRRIKAAG